MRVYRGVDKNMRQRSKQQQLYHDTPAPLKAVPWPYHDNLLVPVLVLVEIG